ncbi:SGNH hydrolase domain-containing protein [Mesorhizobium sp. AaZ16]|uniref:SGNH hydrolase domain-containing protein n=1 Tax=Mesorhizobium sp. AaZ16 TaxID=3402289 RepID=UPI00374F7971
MHQAFCCRSCAKNRKWEFLISKTLLASSDRQRSPRSCYGGTPRRPFRRNDRRDRRNGWFRLPQHRTLGLPAGFRLPEKYVSGKGEAECKASSEAVKAEIGKYSTVIIAASWGNEAYQTSAFRADLRSTVRQLTSAGASVVLVADIPRIPNFDARCEAKAIKFPWWDCTDRLRPRLAMVDKANASIRSTAVEFGAAFVDFSNFICTKGLCSNRIGGEPAYYDGRHLSFDGSVALGKLAAQDPAIQDAFAQFRSSTTATSQQALPWRTDPTGVFERMTSISEIVASADAMLVDRWVGRTRATPSEARCCLAIPMIRHTPVGLSS